jgi:hypothetical protein
MCELSELSELCPQDAVGPLSVKGAVVGWVLLRFGGSAGGVPISPLFHEDDQDDQDDQIN